MKESPWTSRLVWLAGILITSLTLRDYLAQWVNTGSFLGSYSPRLAVVLGLVLLSGLGAAIALLVSLAPLTFGMRARLEEMAQALGQMGVLPPLLGLGLGLLLPALFVWEPWNQLLFTSFNARLWAAWGISLAQVLVWWRWRGARAPWNVFSASLLVCGLLMLLFNFRNDLSASPFSLAWSEGSRFYNASLWAAPQVYGQTLPLPELHPTRYLLQSLAFWVPGATIAFHRAWQVFLWIFCNGLAAWALTRRLRGPGLRGKLNAALFGGWVFLFFFMGPVYYHLILCAVPVLWGFDRAHFKRSLALGLVASVWAGLSRINWFPVPGILAATLYLLEEPLQGRPLWRYLLRPAGWVGLGLGAALLANAAYVRFSGNPPEVFGSALSSPLLWYRLLPNATYGPGVLLAGLLLLPAFAAVAWGLLPGLRCWHWLRWLGLAAVLVVFTGGGLVVSIKVGGGSNLHNMDSLLVFLAVIAGYVVYRRFTPDQTGAPQPAPLPRWLRLVNLALPVIVAASLLNLAPRPTPKLPEAQALQWLQGMIDRYAQDGRPVLFISERQLLSFDQLSVKAFEPSYEKVFLMEMAMSGNPAYLEQYFNDIKQRKFSLIISEPMNMRIQQEEQFSEENNFWVRRIEEPTVGRYQLAGKLDDYPIAVYIPIPVK